MSPGAHPRTVVVTGGSRGLGRAVVLRHAEPGVTVVVNFATNDEAAEHTADEAERRGAQAIVVQSDMGTSEGVSHLLDVVRVETGRLDVLVHNAFHLVHAPPLVVSPEELDRALDVGPKALLHLVRDGLDLFPVTGGRVVCTLSLATQRLFNKRGTSYYPMAAAKAMLEVSIRYLAVELAPRGVTVNGVSAGYIATENMLHEDLDAFRDAIGAKTPLGRIATPEEIANVAHFLGSDEGRWITGQIVVADGGFSLL